MSIFTQTALFILCGDDECVIMLANFDKVIASI